MYCSTVGTYPSSRRMSRKFDEIKIRNDPHENLKIFERHTVEFFDRSLDAGRRKKCLTFQIIVTR